MFCEQISTINEIKEQYTQNTEKILCLEKRNIHMFNKMETYNNNTQDIKEDVKNLKNLCVWILGVLFALLIAVIGGLISIITIVN